jgi:hypothetical protein
MAREPKHDDGSTAHSPHRVYPPNFYTLIFRNHKTLRELKGNPLSIYMETIPAGINALLLLGTQSPRIPTERR